MRRLIMTAVHLLLLMSAAIAGQDDIVGKWAAIARTRGGLGGVWILNQLVMRVYLLALVDFRYSVKDHTLKTVVNDPYIKKVEEDSSPYEIVGDTLITNPTDTTRRQEMKRVDRCGREQTPL
jgi:hypothetical protein